MGPEKDPAGQSKCRRKTLGGGHHRDGAGKRPCGAIKIDAWKRPKRGHQKDAGKKAQKGLSKEKTPRGTLRRGYDAGHPTGTSRKEVEKTPRGTLRGPPGIRRKRPRGAIKIDAGRPLGLGDGRAIKGVAGPRRAASESRGIGTKGSK